MNATAEAPPAPRSPRDVLIELLDTRLELGAQYVAHGQFAELQYLLDLASLDADALVSIDDGAVQVRIDAYAPKKKGRRRRARKAKKARARKQSRPGPAKETKRMPCPRGDGSFKVPRGLRIHARREHGKSLEELQKEASA